MPIFGRCFLSSVKSQLKKYWSAQVSITQKKTRKQFCNWTMTRLVLFLTLCLGIVLVSAQTTYYLGPSTSIPSGSYLFIGSDGTTTCKICTIDCNEFINAGIFSTCGMRYYNYGNVPLLCFQKNNFFLLQSTHYFIFWKKKLGCHLQSQCVDANSASRPEIISALTFCNMFNNCTLTRTPSGGKWETKDMLKILEDRFKKNWKNAYETSFDDLD